MRGQKAAIGAEKTAKPVETAENKEEFGWGFGGLGGLRHKRHHRRFRRTAKKTTMAVIIMITSTSCGPINTAAMTILCPRLSNLHSTALFLKRSFG